MKLKPNLSLLVVGFSLLWFAGSALADQATEEALPRVAAIEGASETGPRVDCGDPGALTPEAQKLAGCFVQVECSDGSIVSCSGNSSCSTAGTAGRCVVCDGVNQGCCSSTCCETCIEEVDFCVDDCFGDLGCIRFCNRQFRMCQNSCAGGCS